jgi:hypothetical protein
VRILKIDPKERLTIDEIFSHEWFHNEEGSDSAPPVVEIGHHQVAGFDHVGTSELDETIVAGMEALGMDINHLKLSLQNCQPDHLSALFFLLRKAKTSTSLPYAGDQYFPRLERPVEDGNKTPEKSEKPTSLLSKVSQYYLCSFCFISLFNFLFLFLFFFFFLLLLLLFFFFFSW